MHRLLPWGGAGCMYACPCFVHLGDVVDSNALFYVLLLPTGLKQCSLCELAGHSRRLQRCCGRQGPWREVPPFKMPTLNKETLHHEDSMRDGYHPKMLLYVLDELFYIYAQIKHSQRVDDKLVLAYEILCISANQCTDWQNGIEKTGVPDALALLNVNDICHLEHLMWAVYDGTLLVGPWPELWGDRSWCTVLAGLHKHIYRGCDDTAHCLPQTLGSWDCQERIEALRQVGGLSSMQSRQRQASQSWRRSQSSSRHRSQMPAQGTRDGHSCGPCPHMPSRCHHGVTSPPCIPLRCYYGMATSPDISTMPKVASAVNIPSYARLSLQ